MISTDVKLTIPGSGHGHAPSGLVWSRLVWSHFDWSHFDWSRLDWSHFDWSHFDWSRLDWSHFDWSHFDWSRLDWSRLDLVTGAERARPPRGFTAGPAHLRSRPQMPEESGGHAPT
ncbi:hypothetical protein Ahu01nite_007810 [Winogradskya humida]|uniref:Pentapeptide repeat protein n=1 Tax=Winogradskya humida TaxID=113566 RepID=A0ABQ3ZGH5_9ACTN|nr:hypothetical protein Ahu01nite_007810 [Actinoplanes humidus]